MTLFQMGSVFIFNIFMQLMFRLLRERDKWMKVNKRMGKIAQNKTEGIPF